MSYHSCPEEGAIRINVGGFRRRLLSDRLSRFPETRLARLLRCGCRESELELCDDYDESEREFYFDRNPALFPYVLHFYNTGRLHVMDELCIFSFSQEMEYWGIDALFLDACCSAAYHCRRMEPAGERSEQHSTASSVEQMLELYSAAGRFETQPLGRLRRRVWLTLDHPAYSACSRLLSALSVLVLLASIACMCLNSMSEFALRDAAGRLHEDPRFETVERLGIGWFTLELLARLAAAPDLRRCLLQPLTLIDLLSVLPFYLALLLQLAESCPLLNLGRAAQVLRLMRVLRVLQLVRHSTGLRSLGATLAHSLQEVGLLLLYLAVGVCFFSVMAYTVEQEGSEGLGSVPASWWWATVSMTTVGYGDVVPASALGKLTAAACILAGILMVVLPITLIFNKFSLFYKRQQRLELLVRRCPLDAGLKVAPALRLTDYYTHKMKSLMASLTNMSRSEHSDHSLELTLH
ncbi:delayed-rectifier potassium channel regulatory subunit KCNS2 [Danio rerio]|uniref:Delayed-rectifier potassium channel regulatory subunit KCNS2 n=1 Tax=Danio rerio TaxID=7955 RepID=A0AC58HI95_DANRE